MKNIYLIRHGITDWNIEGRIQGFMESNLTNKGKEQAEAAGKYLKDTHIDIIYTSPLSRAYKTAEIINSYQDTKLVKSDLLKEGNFGIWEGKTLDEVLKIDSHNYKQWLSYPENCKIEGGETLDDIRFRADSFFEDLQKDNRDVDNILIVAHSTILKILLLSILDMPNENFKKLSLSNTGISKIEVKEYNKVLKFFNLTSHLKEISNE